MSEQAAQRGSLKFQRKFKRKSYKVRKFGGKGLYEIVWSSNEYLTVFPLILFPFMKTVFTEVLLMSPWIKFFVLTSCTYNPERWQRSWWLQQSLHLVGNDTTCISVLRLSDVRRQSDKSSWKKKYPSRDSKYSAVYIWFNTMAKYHFHFLNSIPTSQNALKCLHMEWIFTSHYESKCHHLVNTIRRLQHFGEGAEN